MSFVWSEGRAYTLPSNPNTGDTVVIGDRVWTWDGDKWVITPVGTSPAGATNQIQINNNGAFGAGKFWLTPGGNVGMSAAAPQDWGATSSWLFISNQDVGIRQVFTGSDAAGRIIGTLQFCDANNTASNQSRVGMIGVTTEAGSTAGQRSTKMYFSTYRGIGNVLTDQMTITGAGDIGIGLTEPYSRLHVRAGGSSVLSAINSDTVIFAEHSSNAYLEMVAFGVQAGLLLGGNADTNSSQVMDFWDGANHQLKLTANLPGSYMSLFTAGVEHMRLTAAGNVGIGTITPQSKLSLGSTPDFTNRIALYEGSGSDVRGIGMANPQPSVYGVAIWANKTPSDTNADVFVQDSGNVGIGTTAPRYALSVISGYRNTAATANQIAIGEGSNDAGHNLSLGFFIDGGQWKGVIQVNEGSQQNYLLLNPLGGRVGIGTTSPPSSLSVYTGILPTPAGSTFQGLDVSAFTPNGDSLNAVLRRVYAGSSWTEATWRLGRVVDGTPIADIEFGGDRSIALRTNDQTRLLIAGNGDISIAIDQYVGQNSYVAGGYFGPTTTGSAPILFCPNDFSTAPGQPPSTLCFSLNTAAHSLFIQVRLGNGTYASAAIPLT